MSPGLPTIETDEPKLRIVLDNLVNNAIKFTVHGAVTVSLGVTEGDGQVQLTVDDTGPGIPASDLCRIFEPFHQGEVASNGAHGGVGLGLTIVNRYVILLGGRLDVSSVVGSGSTFMVTLPITTPERDRVLTPRDESPAPSPTITVFEPESRRRPRAA